MKWVTWQNVGIDRIACAWLIQKYIDPDAIFSFIEYGEEVPEDAGTPFDIPGSKYTHRRGRCSFNTFLKEFKLDDKILTEIAVIIDGADCVNELFPAPESFGLEALCVGLRKYLKNDQLAIEQGKLLYESLYAFLKDRANGN